MGAKTGADLEKRLKQLQKNIGRGNVGGNASNDVGGSAGLGGHDWWVEFDGPKAASNTEAWRSLRTQRKVSASSSGTSGSAAGGETQEGQESTDETRLRYTTVIERLIKMYAEAHKKEKVVQWEMRRDSINPKNGATTEEELEKFLAERMGTDAAWKNVKPEDVLGVVSAYTCLAVAVVLLVRMEKSLSSQRTIKTLRNLQKTLFHS